MGNFTAGILFLILSGIGDLLDGAVARATDTVSDFGAFLDSTLDRYVDTLIFLGISLYYVRAGDMLMTVVTYFALLGAVVTSYTAARAGIFGSHQVCRVHGTTRKSHLVTDRDWFP